MWIIDKFHQDQVEIRGYTTLNQYDRNNWFLSRPRKDTFKFQRVESLLVLTLLLNLIFQESLFEAWLGSATAYEGGGT